jgi:dihydrofolate reductase
MTGDGGQRTVPRIGIVAAMGLNRVIGIKNTLPWRLPEDLRHFKRLTMGHHIVMGRKTYDSIGRLLPGRATVIVTRDRDYRLEGAKVAHSLREAIETARGDDEVFFVGGAEIYVQALPLADRLYLTEIREAFEGDAWFPEIAAGQWRETEREPHRSADGLEYHFVVYERVGGATRSPS